MSPSYFDGDEFDLVAYKKLIENEKTKAQWSKNNYDMVKFASERIHSIISEENALRNNRMTWFASIEGFLWLSFAAATRETKNCEPGLWWLFILIPIIGILICISAISVLWDADYATEVLFMKWRVIQECHSSQSAYTHIPVLGLSYKEVRAKGIHNQNIGMPHWQFVLFVLVGWVLGLVGVIVTKIVIWLNINWWGHALIISISWIACWEMLAFKFELELEKRPIWNMYHRYFRRGYSEVGMR